MERVLVTGAAGFIAPAVRAAFHRAGVATIGLDRVPVDRRSLAAAGLDPAPLVVDIVDDLISIDLEGVLSGVDAVVHLAGTPGVQSSWADGFDGHVRNNLLTSQRLCEAALATGRQRLVVASSSSVYGDVPTGAVREGDVVRPLSPYGASKAAMEHLVGAYVERGLSVTPLRMFTVYGPGQRVDMAFHRMFRASIGGPPFPLRGDGSQARSFTFVDDIAAAMVSATRRPLRPGVPINLGGTEVASIREVLDRVGVMVGRPVPIEQLPDAPGDPGRTAADVSRAATLLDWHPTTTLGDGLAAQWRWHRRRAGADHEVSEGEPLVAASVPAVG